MSVQLVSTFICIEDKAGFKELVKENYCKKTVAASFGIILAGIKPS